MSPRAWQPPFNPSGVIAEAADVVKRYGLTTTTGDRYALQYCGVYQRSTLISVLRLIDRHLVKWVKRKYKKRGRYFERAKHWLGQVARYQPGLFAHWRLARPFPAE